MIEFCCEIDHLFEYFRGLSFERILYKSINLLELGAQAFSQVSHLISWKEGERSYRNLGTEAFLLLFDNSSLNVDKYQICFP